jgi:ADP-ribosyl-[dinitrogen reductase] hydrolase
MNLDQAKGCLVGLAVGDAVGTTNEFEHDPVPIFDMVGGGPFHLNAGEWTDDTSMALALGDSLRFVRGFNYREQLDRYLMWYRGGSYCVRRRCFDIGMQTQRALEGYSTYGMTVSQNTSEKYAGNGSLMRLAPVIIWYKNDSEFDAMHWAGESSKTTHAAPQCVDACRYFTRLVRAVCSGMTKKQLLATYVDDLKLHRDVLAVAEINYDLLQREDVFDPSGYVADSLKAALWTFYNTNDFKEGCLAAANLGGDADTVAAIYGQIAGAFYGFSGIPQGWVEKLAWGDWIIQLATDLYTH